MYLQKDSKSPPIHCMIVAQTEKHLWAYVLWSPAEGVGLACYFCETKICEFNVTI